MKINWLRLAATFCVIILGAAMLALLKLGQTAGFVAGFAWGSVAMSIAIAKFDIITYK